MFKSETISIYSLVYVLELEGGHYYIGISTNLNLRLYQHFNGGGSIFTRTYKPIRVVEVVIGDYDTENSKTEEYINIYGKGKVSGGKYVNPKCKANYRANTIHYHIRGILLEK
jgi:predicted GIY-YIG superfamily endonuclease